MFISAKDRGIHLNHATKILFYFHTDSQDQTKAGHFHLLRVSAMIDQCLVLRDTDKDVCSVIKVLWG